MIPACAPRSQSLNQSVSCSDTYTQTLVEKIVTSQPKAHRDDIVAQDTALGVNATLTLQNLSTENVVGIDTLNGFQQPMRTSRTDGNVVIPNLVVQDYPLMLHIREQFRAIIYLQSEI